VTNGTAVLGLGDIGPLAGKPVMEGKGVLFKKFSGIDVFDIEINEKDPDKLVEIIAALEPTFGGINLEDIKAPECFYIEKKLRERMNIPVFHDDQHGTAIVVGAAILNGLKVVGKDPKKIKLVTSGAGAAALACLGLLVKLGIPRENIWVTDLAGVVYEGRTELMDEDKIQFVQKTDLRTLREVIAGADVFLGLSAGGVLKQDMVQSMAAKPLIFALANPNPEITPADVKAVRDDAIMATGRTDYPNQVNNVLCFPYIFRGALDCGATKITEEMKLACVRQIADLAKADISEEVASAYAGQELTFGADYLIPKPFDSRLILRIAPAVAKAAVRRSNTIIGSLMVKLGDADALICGLAGSYMTHLERIDSILGKREGVIHYAAVNALMTDRGPLFITDTYVNEDPSAEQLADIAAMAAREVQRFGIVPKVAFLSHSMFGTSHRPSAKRVRAARDLFVERAPDIECDGELHGDAALEPEIRNVYLEDSSLTGSANLLVCPNLDAANILYNVLKTTTSGGVTVGPILMGTAGTAHILTPAATVRRVFNMTALAAAQKR